ncbi:MAG: hypothetical protein GY778_24865, partial [bacterium]|nr:hypothetical protein [bacterium]
MRANKVPATTLLGCGLFFFASEVHGQDGERTLAVMSSDGLKLDTEHETDVADAAFFAPTGQVRGVLPTILWTFDDLLAVPSSVALSPSADVAWVVQDLNNQRLQRFAITGDGTPLTDIPGEPSSQTAGDAAEDADLAVFLNETLFSQPVTVTIAAYTSASDVPLWDFTFPQNFNNIDANSTRVSRDGAVVCCAIRDNGPPEATRLYIFDGPTGGIVGTWDYPDRVKGIDLTDDGSLCLVKQNANGRLIDTATQTEVFTGSVTGGGGLGKISGNGQVIVLGGFNMRIYRKLSGVYTLSTDVTVPDHFFGQVAVSRDGSTVATMSFNFFNFLETSTRAFDVASDTLLGQHDTVGLGVFQDSPAAASVSDHGSVIAVASWGTEDNAHPEVMVFDRQVNLIGSIDTAGSPTSLDLTGDGVYLIAGSKATHANVSGNGGRVTMYQVREHPDPLTTPTFSKVADESTTMPGDTRTFTYLGSPTTRDGDTAFYGAADGGGTPAA